MSSDEEKNRDGTMTVFRPTVEEVEAEERARAVGGGDCVMLGKYGSMYWDYLKESHPAHFAYLALEAVFLCIFFDVYFITLFAAASLSKRLFCKISLLLTAF